MSENSIFGGGERTLQVYMALLAVGVLWALYAVFNTAGLLEWMEISKDEKIYEPMKVIVQYSQGFFLAWWIMELAHVAISIDTRRALQFMQSNATGFDYSAQFRKGDWILFLNQVVLAIGMLGSLVLMMVVPGLLKKAGVDMAVGSAVTLLVWCAYLGPVVFCAFRFHHVGLTRHTRREMADRLETKPQST